MVRLLSHIAVLTAIYLLVLGYVHPGDAVLGAALAVVLVAGARFIRPPDPPREPAPVGSALRRLAGVPMLIGGTLVDVGRGTWTVARYCLRPPPDPQPGFVDIPIGQCGPSSAAAWGIRVGIAPDTVVVEVDEQQGSMLLHVLDATDPAAVRATELTGYERRQRRVFP